MFSCIFARDYLSGGIGFKNSLPFHIKEDTKYFKDITTYNFENKENIVIMGRKTWESIGCRSLNKRINIIISKTLKIHENILNIHIVDSFESALDKAYSFGKNRYIFVIGGVSLYQDAFKHPMLESIYETKVRILNDINKKQMFMRLTGNDTFPSCDLFGNLKTIEYDTYFSEKIPDNFEEVYNNQVETDKYTLNFIKYNRNKNTSEKEYISLVKEILEKGEIKGDRTKTGTVSLFGNQIKFDLSESFPLLTTKFVGLKTVFLELIWMLQGKTNNNTLKKQGCNIWTKNSDDFHKKMIEKGEDHIDGDLGPIYGYNFRSFGGKYEFLKEGENEDKRYIEHGGGFDQIQYVINEIKTNPESRRILFSGWNPLVLDKVCLPCCHFACQFYVRNKKYLDCMLTMRSNDIFLGSPFNIAQYSLLTYMISAMTGYTPGVLTYSVGDAHIYQNHISQIKEQIQRPLRNFPTLKVLRVPEKIEDFEFSDFKLENYFPHLKITGEMAV